MDGSSGDNICNALSTGGCATATCRLSVTVYLGMRRPWSLDIHCWSSSSRQCANNCWTSSVPRRTKCRL